MAKKWSFAVFRNLPTQEKRITLATIFTVSRIILAPFIVVLMIYGYWGAAFISFIAAALSDLIDGKLARCCNQQTYLGACLDPIADKILMLSIFFALAYVPTPLFALPAWFVYLVLAKEIVLVGSATIYLLIRGYFPIRPTRLGKWTTLVQMSFVMWLFACYFFHWMPVKTYYTMLGVMLIMMIASFTQYAIIGLRALGILPTHV